MRRLRYTLEPQDAGRTVKSIALRELRLSRGQFSSLKFRDGLRVPTARPDTTHAWHILRFRFDAEAMGIDGAHPGAVRAVLQRALRAEGVPVQPYQLAPLPMQRALRTREGFGGYPWLLTGGDRRSEEAEEYPRTVEVLDDSLTLQRWHLNPNAGPVLQDWAAAFEKVWEHRDAVAAAARSMVYTPAWHGPVARSTTDDSFIAFGSRSDRSVSYR